MEFLKFFVLLTCIFGFLRAQETSNTSQNQNSSNTPLENAVACVNHLVDPCTNIDKQCNQDYYKYSSCSSACSSNPTDINQYQTCISACVSTNQALAGYITQINNCIILATPSSSLIINLYSLSVIILILIY
ncbi:transmembrane protein, putative (macronuclear) [Tetrahymena thermophila SB210]|uniref:Transmembrane protein, putative n=1 Tax=Tetrahymena thermophila (strain SB210) TaxID=312017 RepID=I7MH76_TETTS|nr:transmembrane protein, putative [Tetrahymena thermophila SB210]EAR87305.1 transmembrane protein, putative [Tetrahymena thermophila SB210]|eukprot:XP_001007550.1 transmembrane protein, putative [Tetrahymena thermophila SB210]